MAGFDAAEIVGEFDYDLSADNNGPKGQVPLPTMAEARKFRDALTAAQRRACGIDIDTPITDESNAALQAALDSLTPEQRDQLNDDALDAVAEICKGHPSRDDLLARSGPVQFAFARWLQVELSPLF